MRVDAYGHHIFTADDLFDHYMRNPDSILRIVTLDKPLEFDPSLEIQNTPHVEVYRPIIASIAEYDKLQQNVWHMPQQYKDLDIAKYVLDMCETEEELQRVGQELLLYQERDMFDLLRYMVYLVDTMRKNKIIWGVGRGSSISSYVLYKLGVHRINSLMYDLDVYEFFK